MDELKDLQKLIFEKKWKRAERLLRAHSGPKSPASIEFDLAMVLRNAGKPEAAGEWLKKAVRKDKSFFKAWFELGRWAVEMRDYSTAYYAFQETYRLLPNNLDSRRNFAKLALRLGKWTEAEAAWDVFDDLESRLAKYRIVMETGGDGSQLRSQLLANPHSRAQALQLLVRTAKGKIPLRLPAVER